MGEIYNKAGYNYTERNDSVYRHVQVSPFYIQVSVFVLYKKPCSNGINGYSDKSYPGHGATLNYCWVHKSYNRFVPDETNRGKKNNRVKKRNDDSRSFIPVSIFTGGVYFGKFKGQQSQGQAGNVAQVMAGIGKQR